MCMYVCGCVVCVVEFIVCLPQEKHGTRSILDIKLGTFVNV